MAGAGDAAGDAALAAALRGRFVLEADEALALAKAANAPDVPALLPRLVAAASARALPPTSGYRVGAAGVGSSGRVFLGANLELPRAPLAHSVHAEQFLVALAAQRGEPRLHRIAVSAAPCGHCRQFCRELAGADALVFDFAGETATLAALLPRHFGPEDLAPPGGPPPPLLLEGATASLELTRAAAARVAATPALAPAAAAALAAARAAHTPHTRCPAGAAVTWVEEGTGEKKVAAGFSIESAAYNPSLPPLQAALVAALAAGLPSPASVDGAVLVERRRGRVAHAPSAALALASFATPGAELVVLHATRRVREGVEGDSGYESDTSSASE